MTLESQIKKGSRVSWVACGATWFGTVKFVYHQFAFVSSDRNPDATLQTFDIVNGNKLTLIEA